MKNIYTTILSSLIDHPVQTVRIGLNWTAVVVEKESGLQCGLSSTLSGEHHHTGEPIIPDPGGLETLSGMELASWITSDHPLRWSVGCAAINALLPREPALWVNQNAEAEILRRGRGKKTVLMGHFPFVKRLRQELDDFLVVELNPIGADLPVEEGWEHIPEADVLAVTGMTFVNHTLQELLPRINPSAYMIMLGPSTPLSPILHSVGFDVLAGAVVEDIPAVLGALGQGANFRQVHHAGVRLVTQAEAR